MKKSYVLVLSFCVILQSKGADSAITTPCSCPDQITQTIEKKEPYILSLLKYLRTFVSLLNSQSVQNGLKQMDAIFVSMVQTLAQIGKETNKRDIQKRDIRLLIKRIEKEDMQAIKAIVKPQTRMLRVLRATPQQMAESDKQEVQAILNSFAGVMQAFFTIVQDPENRQNVTQGVAGILANVINAGKVIVKSSDILLDDDKESISRAIAEIDPSIKLELLDYFKKQQGVDYPQPINFK